MNRKKLYILIAICVICLVAIMVEAGPVKEGKANAVEKIASNATAPVQGFLANSGRKMSGIWQSLTRSTELSDENKRLKAEIYAMKEQLEELNRTRDENKKLRKLLDISKVQKGKVITAEVIARDPDNWFQSIKVNKGYKHGVKKDMVALAPEGIVGRVVSASPYTAKIQLLFNDKSAIPAQFVSSGELGVVYGEGKNTCIMRYINAEAKVEVGDQIITSRLSNIYPSQKILGKVTKLYGRDQLLYQAVQVRPAIQFGNLEFVLLVGED
ncbi:MAG: rod shape-determining protein MreC [Vulcanimicrobiota bacterium]